VALGVGFSIAMAALLQGSQDDFVEQFINAIPNVQISDERRTANASRRRMSSTMSQIESLAPR
jgi:lipoprotein-releasing system permease protein